MPLVKSMLAAEAKAAIGTGVYAIENYAPLQSLSRSPQKLMHEAQQLYHNHIWVNAAERAVNGRLARAPIHFERPDGESVTPDVITPAEQAVVDLITRPNKDQGRLRTRRGLWGLTSRHGGLCGTAFWYLDRTEALAGTPLGLLYINPVRMTPATTDDGTLLGWVLDHPQNPVTGQLGKPGIPLRLDEVEQFTFDEPDDGHFGIGIPEASMAKLELTRLADRHAAQVLGTGGRLAGMLAPKPQESGAAINNDEWESIIRGWRQIANDPESAKRLHIVKGPVDFTATAMKATEMQLVELAKMGRTDIMAAWHVPESQIGIHGASGLNSGEHIKFEEAALWQGPIESRVQMLSEPIQRIIDRFEPFGVRLTLVIETPSFDDDQPLYINAERARIVPLTVNERRALVNKDPLDDPRLGSAIFLDAQMVRVDDVADEQDTEVALPEEQAAPKASLPEDLVALRSRIERSAVPAIRKGVAALLGEMAQSIAERVERYHDHLAANPSDDSVWWNQNRWSTALELTLQPALAGVVGDVAGVAAQRVQRAGPKANDYLERVLAYVRLKGGDRIRGILLTTLQTVQKAVNQGIREGLSPAELGRRIRESSAFGEARSEMIARTETMLAYNDAALGSYRTLDVEEVQAIDGDEDAECAARNGKTFTLDEASGISDHPNGTLDWIPLVAAGAKARRITLERDVTGQVVAISEA